MTRPSRAPARGGRRRAWAAEAAYRALGKAITAVLCTVERIWWSRVSGRY